MSIPNVRHYFLKNKKNVLKNEIQKQKNPDARISAFRETVPSGLVFLIGLVAEEVLPPVIRLALGT